VSKRKYTNEDLERHKAMTAILKKKLMLMIIKEWNGKDFTNLDDVSKMTDDILECLGDVGSEMDD